MFTYRFINHLSSILEEDTTTSIARCSPFDFTRTSPLQVPSLCRYILCRTGETTANQIMVYFSSIDALESAVSKQAIFQAREKLDPNVFRYLNDQSMKYYYQYGNAKTCKGCMVVAVDGSVGELPYNEACLECFGTATHKTGIKTKTLPRISGVYDVLNQIFIDVSIDHFQTSEIPMAHEQIFRLERNYPETKKIYLADRYYGAIDTFMYLEEQGNFYCFRGKKNYFKKEVAEVERDGIITISLTPAWIQRFKIEEIKEHAYEHPTLEIRVIKFHKSEVTKLKDEKDEEILLFTNLKDGWSREELITLYGKRWRIESGYGVLKTKQEIERVTSEKPQLLLQDMYSQVVVHNIVAIAKQEIDKEIQRTENYCYQVNIQNLIILMRSNLAKLLYFKEGIKKLLLQIINIAKKYKEPIRENRFFERWDIYIAKPPTLKFRVDGKRNPKVHRTARGFLRKAS